MQRKKERKRARDMDRDHTFDLPDLTEDFWKTVVFAQEDPPSGMGARDVYVCSAKREKSIFSDLKRHHFTKVPSFSRSLRRPMKELVIVINIKQKITAGNIWRKKMH